VPLKRVDHRNAATPVEALRSDVVDVGSFYVRSNFDTPIVDPETWSLQIEGNVERPYHLDLPTLQTMPTTTLRVAMECAGNFRTLMDPVPGGTPWGLGAAAAADFTGVRASEVLAASSPRASVREWVFTGADRGTVDPDGEIPYAFPLEADVVAGGDALIAWEMNGAPLTPEHGGPVRLVVPGHYGMRSVKWLTSIEAVDEPFTGHFRRKYRYYGSATEPEGAAVDLIRVRSMVTDPAPGPIPAGPTRIAGVAWSGHGGIRSVEVRVGAGDWVEAAVEPGAGPHAMSRWSVVVAVAPGEHAVTARATDTAGFIQPLVSPWNRNGYGNNVVHEIAVVAVRD
jgi:DMSO/TMAO reductase YedYZ molybdopterin-dependent catalytic subunit